MKTYNSKRGRLLHRYHSELKFKSVHELRDDKKLLGKLLDQYRQSMDLHHKMATEEEIVIRKHTEQKGE